MCILKLPLMEVIIISLENYEINFLPGEEFREITDLMIEGIEVGRYYISNNFNRKPE